MTRILVLSDLHLEQRPFWSLPTKLPAFDIAVFAGDIDGSPKRAVEQLAVADGLAGRPMVYVPGNHEAFGGVIEDRLREGREAARGTTVHMLDRDIVVIAGVRILGATMWTDYALFGDPVTAQVAALMGLADHQMIATLQAGRRRRFLPGHALARHERERAFVAAELARPFDGPTVVVTHHAPHRGSIHPRFAADALTPAFVADLSALIAGGRPDLWIHGHVHDAFDYMVGPTRVLCNPKGYGPVRRLGRFENRAFDATKVVEV